METYKELAHELPLKHADFTTWRFMKIKREQRETKIQRAYNTRTRLRTDHH